MSNLGGYLRKIQRNDSRLDGYLLGLKHGISLADLDHRYNTQIREIEEMRRALEEHNGQKSATEDHPGA